MYLFDHIPRTDQDYSRYNEGTFQFLNRSAKPEFEAVRERLNMWFKAYPEHLKAKFKNDFKKKMPAAFFELYCHQQLLEKGWQVEAQPSVQVNGKTLTPDFFIQKNGQSFYVEATVIKSKSNEAESYENKCNVVKEKIASRFAHRYAMHLEELELFGKVDPKLKQLTSCLDSFISNIEISNDPFKELQKFHHADDELKITISFFPKSITPPIDDNKFVMETGGFVWGDNVEILRKAVLIKARKYKSLPHLLIIMVNVINRKGLYKQDVETALFGDKVSGFNLAGVPISYTKNNGLFSDGSSTSMKNVAKVIFTRVNPFHNRQEEVYEFVNPNN